MKTRAPPHEARRAEPPQAAKRARQNPPQADWQPRRTPPIFTRAALPAGHRPAWLPRATPEAEASERTASEFHPQPAKHAAGVLARRGQPPPAQAAPSRVSGGAVAEAGAAIPSDAKRSEGQRSGAAGAYGGEGRAKGGLR